MRGSFHGPPENLDEDAMWPTAFALKELTAAEEARIAALVKKTVSWGLSNPMATAGACPGDTAIDIREMAGQQRQCLPYLIYPPILPMSLMGARWTSTINVTLTVNVIRETGDW
jgi:hypothetical protein